MTRLEYSEKGVYMTELSDNSKIRVKKIQEKHDRDLSLLQIMIDNHAIVYNLQPENKYEVALIDDIDAFANPINFCMTGFEMKTRNRTLTVN